MAAVYFDLCDQVETLFMQEPRCLEIAAPALVFGERRFLDENSIVFY